MGWEAIIISNMSINKHWLHRIWKRIRPISHWYFLGLFLIFLVIGLVAMRNNNLRAIQLRDKVIAADSNNGDIESALRELRTYVYSHMNAHLSGGSNSIYPPIQLKYRYDRLVQAEKDKVSATNAKVYSDAQVVCEQQFPAGLSGKGRIPCITQYVTDHGAKEQINIPDSLYKFDFVSPVWSPDRAGWSLLAAGVFAVLFLVRLVLEYWFRYELKG